MQVHSRPFDSLERGVSMVYRRKIGVGAWVYTNLVRAALCVAVFMTSVSITTVYYILLHTLSFGAPSCLCPLQLLQASHKKIHRVVDRGQ